MRFIASVLIACLPLLSFTALAEDTAELEAKGIAALKLSQTDGDAIVSAAILFGKAADAYEKAGDDAKATEMNSFLYWCKKKMTLQQMDAFLKGGDAINAAVVKRMKELDAAPKIDEAQSYFDRAEGYAKAHPNEHLLTAIRFFEVAGRFKGVELSFQAQERSLQEMTLEKTGAANAAAKEIPAAVPAPPGKKVAMPPAVRQKEAEKTINELYKDDFAKSESQDKIALATKLEKQSDESANDDAARYVLLTKAAALSAQAGDVAKLSAIFGKLTTGFEFDFKDFMKAQLNVAMPKTTDAKLAKVVSAMKVVIDKPDDAAANLMLGKHAIQEGDFERAAPFILKSKNAALIDLAKQEQPPPANDSAQAALADAWWELGQKAPDKDDKYTFHSRAAFWYKKAVPSLAGLAKSKVEKRLVEFAAESAAARGAVDLLSILDLRTDTVSGKWKFDGTALISPKSKPATIVLPYRPPEEYTLEIQVERLEGSESFAIGLVAGKYQFRFEIDSSSGKFSGVDSVDGKTLWDNTEVKKYGRTIDDSKPHQISIDVRKTLFSVSIDGNKLIDWKPDYTRLSNHWESKRVPAEHLFLGSWDASWKVTKLVVTPVSGKGSISHPVIVGK